MDNYTRAQEKIQAWIDNGDDNRELSLDRYNLTELPVLPDNLRRLSCRYNKLTTLPNLPNTLTKIQCSYNNLTLLPVLPHGLTSLACDDNKLKKLPLLPSSILNVYCRNNLLTKINKLPKNLERLFCGNNLLFELTDLPGSLVELSCEQNDLTILPKLPPSLEELFCNINKLKTLPSLPIKLNKLFCSKNELTKLPSLPHLKELTCSLNRLTKLPSLPKSLFNLDCSHNLITELPKLPKGLQFIKYFDNPLRRLPENHEGLVVKYKDGSTKAFYHKEHFKDNIDKTKIYEDPTKNENVLSSFSTKNENYLSIKYDSQTSSKIQNTCSNKLDLLKGDKLDASHGITILYEAKYDISDCYLPGQLNDMWKNDFGKAQTFENDDKTKPVYKIRGTDNWIDFKGYMNTHLFTCLSISDESRYSALSESHGSIYTLNPISITEWIIQKDPRKVLDSTKNFVPSVLDICSDFIDTNDPKFVNTKECIGIPDGNHFTSINNELVAVFVRSDKKKMTWWIDSGHHIIE